MNTQKSVKYGANRASGSDYIYQCQGTKSQMVAWNGQKKLS